MSHDPAISRRRFTQWAAAGAALGWGGVSVAQHLTEGTGRLPDPVPWAPRSLQPPITGPGEAINVFDFETVAHAKVPPAHFGYLASGIDDEVSLRSNREGFQKFRLRPRRLVDVSKVDLRMQLFGETYPTPVILAPIGGHRAYHPEGEIATARAAAVGNHLMILSSMTSTKIEQVAAARGRPLWFQLYPTNRFEIARALVQHAERAGCHAVAVTVDRSGGRNQETLFRMRRTDARVCGGCHNTPNGPGLPVGSQQPMWDGIDLAGLPNIQASALNWEILKRIRDTTRMKCVVKGLLTAEDAALAADAGYDAIIVSNHGGRADEAGVSTIECLPEIVAAVKGRMPILIDSGFRRGTDIVKALAMGATGVAIGRPYLWGLGAFGQPGVERVLELVRLELLAAMQQIGAPASRLLTPAMVQHI